MFIVGDEWERAAAVALFGSRPCRQGGGRAMWPHAYEACMAEPSAVQDALVAIARIEATSFLMLFWFPHVSLPAPF